MVMNDRKKKALKKFAALFLTGSLLFMELTHPIILSPLRLSN